MTVNGNRLLGYSVDDQFQLQTAQLAPLSVPVGSIQVAQETENVFLEGSLPPIGGVADTAGVLDSAPLGTAAIPRPDSTGLDLRCGTDFPTKVQSRPSRLKVRALSRKVPSTATGSPSWMGAARRVRFRMSCR